MAKNHKNKNHTPNHPSSGSWDKGTHHKEGCNCCQCKNCQCGKH